MRFLGKIAAGALVGIVAELLRERAISQSKLPELHSWRKVSDESDPANY